MTLTEIHGPLALTSAVSWLLTVICQFANLDVASISFSFLAAATGVAVYFTGKKNQSELKAELKQVRTKQLGRRLDDTQRKKLVNTLLSIDQPLEPIHFIGVVGNREAINLAKSLKQLFEKAGLTVDGVREDMLIGGTGSGILIRYNNANSEIGNELELALQNAGLEVRAVAKDRDKYNHNLELIVGHKP